MAEAWERGLTSRWIRRRIESSGMDDRWSAADQFVPYGPTRRRCRHGSGEPRRKIASRSRSGRGGRPPVESRGHHSTPWPAPRASRQQVSRRARARWSGAGRVRRWASRRSFQCFRTRQTATNCDGWRDVPMFVQCLYSCGDRHLTHRPSDPAGGQEVAGSNPVAPTFFFWRPFDQKIEGLSCCGD